MAYPCVVVREGPEVGVASREVPLGEAVEPDEERAYHVKDSPMTNAS